MAWAVRGTNLASGTSGTTIQNTHGITISDGDLVIVTAVEDQGDADMTIDDSGWTAVTNSPTTGNGCGQTGWCKLASTEPSSYTVGNKTDGNAIEMRVTVFYDDAGGTLTIDDTDAASSVGDQASLTSPTVTTDDNWLTYYSFGNDTGPSIGRTISANPSGTEVGTHSGSGVGIATWYKTGASAGTDSNSITFNASDGISVVVVSAHFTPAGGGGIVGPLVGGHLTRSRLTGGRLVA